MRPAVCDFASAAESILRARRWLSAPYSLCLVLIASFFISPLATTSAHAAFSPLSISIFPPVQFPPEDFSITGARLSVLWGKQRNIYGIDLGLIGNATSGEFSGLGIAGGFNLTRGTTDIWFLQLAGITNINLNKTRVLGVQAALGANYNAADTRIIGVQIAPFANYSPFTRIYGAQLALYNKADTVWGLQIGLVNVAKNLRGIQIGLLNFNLSGTLYVSPLINVGF